MNTLLLLGASGSIGKQTIDVVSQEKNFTIAGVSINSHTEVLEEELKFLPALKWVGIAQEAEGREFQKKHPEYTCFIGSNCNVELVKEANYDKAVNALVGEAGFLPSLEVLKRNKDLCLANKESLVIGGKFIKEELKKGHGRLFPIDSEHVALMKLLNKVDRNEVKRMIITASGGSLRDVREEELMNVTIEQVLKHPTWHMGSRITVDSATMVNKGFEFIEASYLYDWDIDNISVWINDESQIHSALEMKDHSYFFEVGPSDMRIPISYALNEGRRVEMAYKSLDFNSLSSLNFRPFSSERYPLFPLVLQTFKKGGTGMAFFNAVDEEAVQACCQHKISFKQMNGLIRETIEKDLILLPNPTPEDIVSVDKKAREIIKAKIQDYK